MLRASCPKDLHRHSFIGPNNDETKVMIQFYFHNTPNPRKVALMLEETQLPYELVPVDTYRGEQHLASFRAINPNGKVPAIVDEGTTVFDSNAILLYLADKTGRFRGAPAERGTLLSWLMFVASGLGPFSGQAVHFSRVHGDSPYANNRYRREVERHYAVLDQRLATRPFIVGSEYTIVDIAAWGWIGLADFVLNGNSVLDATPNLKRWFAAVDARPAAVRARLVGQELKFKTEFDEATQRAMFPQNFDASPR
jgi:GSH-dependent disulfide-bond oxidoreductase